MEVAIAIAIELTGVAVMSRKSGLVKLYQVGKEILQQVVAEIK